MAISYIAWIIVSSVIPQTILRPRYVTTEEMYPGTFDLNTEVILSEDLASKSIYVLVAHPDDEVMFFAPTILMLNRPKYGNHIKLVSFSNGDYEKLGSLREKELQRSCQILGIEHQVLTFVDDINVQWDSQDISNAISEILHQDGKDNVVLITFDEKGVSNHPNHKSVYYGAVKLAQDKRYKLDLLYTLKSWNFFTKYSFNLVTTYELFQRMYATFIKSSLEDSIDMIKEPTLKIYLNVNNFIVALASMSAAHFSQMVYFRYGWLLLSKYLNSNELVRVDI